MTMADLAAVGELVGGLGVLVTLVYLAIQIRNHTREVRSERLRSELNAYIAQQTGYISGHDSVDVVRRGLYAYDVLDPKEKLMFHYVMVNQILAVQNFVQQHQDGLIPRVDLMAWLDMVCQMLSSKGGSEYWSQMSGIFTPTITDAINTHLQGFAKPSYVDQYPFFDDLKASEGH